MRRDGLQTILAVTLVVACSNSPNADTNETVGDSTGTAPTTDTPTTESPSTGTADEGLCVPGYEGCPCFDDARCISGLMCLSNYCVSVPDDTTSIGDPTLDDSSSSTSASEDESSSGDGESTSTGLPDVCVDDDTYCDDEDLQTCVDGQWVYADCVDACGATGFGGTECRDADSCLCVGHSDAFCDTATYNHCICVDALFGEIACSSEQFESEYAACFAEVSALNSCWHPYQINTLEDCEAAVAECGV